MKIHILDKNYKPIEDSLVYSNCGASMRFLPIEITEQDKQLLCPECVRIHSQNKLKQYSFTVVG